MPNSFGRACRIVSRLHVDVLRRLNAVRSEGVKDSLEQTGLRLRSGRRAFLKQHPLKYQGDVRLDLNGRALNAITRSR
jgi:hypothetical protein